MAMTTQQMEREITELRRLVRELTRPKSVAKVINVASPNQFYVYEITTTYSANECVATIDNLDGTEVETGATVVDPTGGSFSNAPTSAKGICVRDGAVYYALGPYVSSVNWTSPNLTYNKGGGVSINVDTAEDC